MNNKIKKITKLGIISILSCTFFACSSGSEEPEPSEKSEVVEEKLSVIHPISYENINSVDDIDLYESEVKKNGENNDDPVENGIVNCPYYTLKINNIDVPVYSTRCGLDVHSFTWVDIEDDKDIKLNVELSLKNTHKNVVVLPESSKVVPTLENNVVKATINSLGSFSFAFDKKIAEGLTIYVALKEECVVPEGYSKQEFNPGNYKIADTTFSDSNVVYYFKKGIYNLSSIYLPSNSIAYFESGTYVHVITETPTDRTAAIRSSGTSNIKVQGRALFDFSLNQGGPAGHQGKGMYNFLSVDTMHYSGITSINSSAWTLCFTNCKNVEVERTMILGYRTCSDGIMLSDCQDSTVKYCFVRTGDDAIEVKSTGSNGTKNLLYEYNAVWTDKARGYGCIYESNKDVENVTFRNNSIGFASPTWSPNLGCLVIAMGTRQATVWRDVHFENIEIYKSNNALINIVLEDSNGNGVYGGTAKDIYFSNIKARYAYGYVLRINVQKGSTLGKVFLDQINYNNKYLQEEDIDNADIVSIANSNTSWSKKSNVKINSL